MAAQRETSSPASGETVILRATGLVKSYQMGNTEVTVLKGTDLAVRAGEFLAIEGRSGSGKSTLLHLLGALDTPDEGSISFEGQQFEVLSAAARSRLRSRSIGFIFQSYHLLPELNVLENTLLPAMVEFSTRDYRAKKRELVDRAHDLLEKLGMSHRLKHRPRQLSGGESQRVAIARALMNDPKIVLADEPTGNLDVETGQQIMALLERLHQTLGKTVVMVTHDRTLASEADRTLFLKSGRLSGEPNGHA